MSPDERNIFGEYHESPGKLRLLEENYRQASQLINTSLPNPTVRVPRVLATEGNDITVWEFIEGIPFLEKARATSERVDQIANQRVHCPTVDYSHAVRVRGWEPLLIP